jgi:hypothetical protein
MFSNDDTPYWKISNLYFLSCSQVFLSVSWLCHNVSWFANVFQSSPINLRGPYVPFLGHNRPFTALFAFLSFPYIYRKLSSFSWELSRHFLPFMNTVLYSAVTNDNSALYSASTRINTALYSAATYSQLNFVLLQHMSTLHFIVLQHNEQCTI